MADDFFKEETPVAETPVEEAKVKVGEVEYLAADLDKLVALGKIAQEAEEKYDRPISKYWPEFTKTKQEADALRAELEELKTKATATPVNPNGDLTPEQVKQQALQQADELGLVTKSSVDSYVRKQIEGYRLLDNITALVDEAVSDGKPKATQEEVLKYMSDTGIKNPKDAYELMFRDELKGWEKKQVETIKKPSMVTEETSTAGAKEFEAGSVTKDNLKDKIAAYFNSQGQ